MAELVPAPFADLVTRLFVEPQRQDALFELPRRKWYLGPASPAVDLSVQFHGRRAGNPSGPAAGPHTQMAQNLLLSYVAGGRILELKTVQVNDRLTIGRPCIDLTNVGYNIEWSQELRIEESLREYVAGAMLIEMFRRSHEHSQSRLDGPAGDVIYDISIGYDLEGIRSNAVCGFLDGMRNAGPLVESLRAEIPAEFRLARDIAYPTHLSDSITLSTFHGCPAGEIERIGEFLIGDMGFDVIVKMNPPTLGKERLEHLLHDVLGYADLTVNPAAYENVISFDASIELCRRLMGFANARGRGLGFKFSNTLEVLNRRDFFKPAEKIMYLSGQPLHVITMTLTDEFRRAVGPDVPISFSAGIDQHNFPTAVACGFVPVTVSTDLLRPGGYGRLPAYLHNLESEMSHARATTIDEFIVRRFFADAPERGNEPGSDARTVRTAGLRNTGIAAERARRDARYRADRNRGAPRRIDSHLTTFDCITCDKCLPVCPNAANFTYPTPLVGFDCHDLLVSPDGSWRPIPEARRFEITEPLQIACYADFCNECGNCDTFCPEYGGPYIKKPTFHGTLEAWERAAPRDGFVVGHDGGATWIRARIGGKIYELTQVAAAIDAPHAAFRFATGNMALELTADHVLVRIGFLQESSEAQVVDMWIYHALRHLLNGVLDSRRINQVNARRVHSRQAPAAGTLS